MTYASTYYETHDGCYDIYAGERRVKIYVYQTTYSDGYNQCIIVDYHQYHVFLRCLDRSITIQLK